MVETRDQQVLALHPSEASYQGESIHGHIQFEMRETASHRQHRVFLDGEEFMLEVPASAPPTHLAFDPRRREFTRLLPSIRLELTEHTDLGAVLDAVQAIGVTEFAPLGFALVDLPADLHPVDALIIIAELEGDYQANVRLPMPPIDLR